MKPRALLLLLLIAPWLPACGEDRPAGPTAPPSGTIDPDLVRMQDWEWYAEDDLHYPEIAGRVVDPEGNPVANAKVTVYIPPLLHVAVPKPVQTIPVDGDGVFRLEDVPANAWILAGAPDRAGRLLTASEVFAAGGGPREFRLRNAAPLSGTVRTEEGEPVEGIVVMASTPAPDWFAFTTSDREGRYLIPDAPQERVQIGIVSDRWFGGGGSVVPSRDPPVAADLRLMEIPPVEGRVVDDRTGDPVAGAAVLAVADRQIVRLTDENGTFRLDGFVQPVIFVRGYGFGEVPVRVDPVRPETQNVRVAMPRGAVLRGRISTSSGDPIAGARAKAVILGPRGARVYEGPLTDAGGAYDFGWLPVSDEGSTGRVVAMKPGWLPGLSEEWRVAKGDVEEGIDVGLVRAARVEGVLHDHEGRPLADARIEAVWSGEAPAGYEEALGNRSGTRTDAEGRFLLTGVRAGRQELTVRATGHVPWVSWLDVPEGTNLDDVTLEIPRGLTISGRVVAAGEREPEGLSLTLAASSGAVEVEVPLAADGRFRVFGLSEGEYVLKAFAQGYEAAVVRARAGREDVALVLRALSELKVTVNGPPDVDLEGWFEVRGLGGEAAIANPLRRPLTPDSNTFTFENLAAGSYLLLVESGDWWARKQILLARGRPADVSLDLSRGGTVEGQVSLPDGRVVSGVGVIWEPTGEGMARGVDTNAEGRYRFRGVPPGDVKVRVHPEGYPPTERVVSVRAGESVKADLVLKVGGRLLVTVRDAEGDPVRGARIGLLDEDGGTARFWVEDRGRTETGADGTIELIGLHPGRYRVVAVSGAARGESAPVEVRDGEASEVDVGLAE